LSAQRRRAAAVPVDEVIDVIKDEEEAQLAGTARKSPIALTGDADPVRRIGLVVATNRRPGSMFSLCSAAATGARQQEKQAMTQAEITTEQKSIQRWIEQRRGRPTMVKGTEGDDGEGNLRVDFAEPDDKLEPIAWKEFFKTFEDRRLAFLYQDKTSDGKQSCFFKFVRRDG
jgi:hypothetical protein